jgi:hypothetical protein
MIDRELPGNRGTAGPGPINHLAARARHDNRDY